MVKTSHRRRLILLAAGAAIVAVGFLSYSIASGTGGGWVTSAQPSKNQLVAMSDYFIQHEGRLGFGSTRDVGCITYSMGTHRERANHLIAYTTVLCQQCPADGNLSALTPVVFYLDGQVVVRERADMQPGDPYWSNVIFKIFPKSLWGAAIDQQIPHVDAITKRANAIACRH